MSAPSQSRGSPRACSRLAISSVINSRLARRGKTALTRRALTSRRPAAVQRLTSRQGHQDSHAHRTDRRPRRHESRPHHHLRVRVRVQQLRAVKEERRRVRDNPYPYPDSARKTRRSPTRTNSTRNRARTTQVDPAAAREWTRANGHTVGDRGRVPATYNAAK